MAAADAAEPEVFTINSRERAEPQYVNESAHPEETEPRYVSHSEIGYGFEVPEDEEPLFISEFEESPLEPAMANFLETELELWSIALWSGPESPRSAGPDAFAACRTIGVSRFEAALQTTLQAEERPVMLIEPVEGRGAISIPAMPLPVDTQRPIASFDSHMRSPEPGMADFVSTEVMPWAGAASLQCAEQDAFPACQAIVGPQLEALLQAMLPEEERPVMLIETVAVDGAISAAATPQPADIATCTLNKVDWREYALEPAMADFLATETTPLAGVESPLYAEQGAFPACQQVGMTELEAGWQTAMLTEERPLILMEPVEGASASALVGAPEPFVFFLSSPARRDEVEIGAVALETAAAAFVEEPRAATAEVFTSSNAEALGTQAMELAAPAFSPSIPMVAHWSPMTGAAELTPHCRQLVSTAVPVGETALVHEFYALEFNPSPAAMQCAEFQEAPEEAAAPDPEIAPAMVVSSTPHDRPVSLPAFSPHMLPPALEFQAHPASASSPAQLSFSFPAPDEVQGAVADPPHGLDSAAKTSAGPHAHEPLRPAFGSSVKIKNWRLRITFAKPA